MKEELKTLLENALPLVNPESDFLFAELDSLGVATILLMLSEKYGIKLDHTDATPRNLKNIEALAALVERKLAEKAAGKER